MSIFSAMSAGVSGLSGQSKKFQTISDNVSNIGTTGYKASRMDFASLVVETASQSGYSAGSVTARTRRQIDGQGAIQATERPTDLAISGNGFFAVRGDLASPAIEFTRAGSFDADPSGFLRNSAGKYLMGFPVSEDGTVMGAVEADLRPVSISGVGAIASKTKSIAFSANLPADPLVAKAASPFDGLVTPPRADDDDPTRTVIDIADRAPRAGERWSVSIASTATTGSEPTFDVIEVVARDGESIDDVMVRLAASSAGELEWTPADDPLRAGTLSADATLDQFSIATHGGHRMPATVHDALGNAHRLDLVCTKLDAPGVWSIDVEGPRLSGIRSGTVGPGFPAVLQFDTAGRPAAGQELPKLTIAWDTSVANGEDSLIDINLANMSQLGGSFEVADIRADGAGLGRLAAFAFDSSGFLNMTFTNGIERPAFRVPLATFVATNGLAPVSGNSFRATTESGASTFSQADSGAAGSIVAGAVEASAVDLAAEMTSMIVTQNAYAANVKTITTADEMLRELGRLKS